MANPLAAYIGTPSPAQPATRSTNPLARFVNDGDLGQSAPEPERSALDYIGEMIGNVPGTAVDAASDFWSAVSSPIDTAKMIGGAALGAGQLAKDALGIPSPGLFGEHRDSARAVGTHYSDRYGGGQEFLDTLRTDPVGTVLDVAGVLTGGAGAAARLPGVTGRLARAITNADPFAAGGRAAAAGGRAAERAIQARRSTPSTREFIADAPGPEQLRAQGSALFEQAEASGVRFKSGPFGEFADSLLERLIDEGADNILTPKISRVADVLEQSKTRAPSIQQMAILRRQFGNAAGSADRAEARLGSIAIDLLDDFVESGASHIGGQLSEARTMWSRLKKSEILDTAIENAGAAQAGVEAGLRNEFRTLYKARNSKKMRGFSDAELAAIRAVAQGNFGASVLRRIGSLAGGLDQGRNMLNLLGGVGAGAYVGGPVGAVAVPALAYGARGRPRKAPKPARTWRERSRPEARCRRRRTPPGRWWSINSWHKARPGDTGAVWSQSPRLSPLVPNVPKKTLDGGGKCSTKEP